MKGGRHVLDFDYCSDFFCNLAFLLASGLDCGHSAPTRAFGVVGITTGDFHCGQSG